MSKAFDRTVDEILVHADPDLIFRIAADVQDWARILPHYRWVRVLDAHDGYRTVEMAARRGWIPVKWTSIQTVDAVHRRVHYHHVGGLTRGMEVEWIIERDGDRVRVTIVHEMSLTTPVVRSLVGRWITGRFFVHHIAGRTLSRMREIVEEERLTGCAEQ